jgi:hypothetical protein
LRRDEDLASHHPCPTALELRECLPGLHTDPDLDLGRESVPNAKRGADGTLSVVLVGDGRSEDCDECASGGVFDRRAEASGLLARDGET